MQINSAWRFNSANFAGFRWNNGKDLFAIFRLKFTIRQQRNWNHHFNMWTTRPFVSNDTYWLPKNCKYQEHPSNTFHIDIVFPHNISFKLQKPNKSRKNWSFQYSTRIFRQNWWVSLYSWLSNSRVKLFCNYDLHIKCQINIKSRENRSKFFNSNFQLS